VTGAPPRAAPAARRRDIVADALLGAVAAAPLGLAVGSACALFLWSLDRVTALRWQHPWMLYLLPLAGLGVGLLYHAAGRSVEGGSNLLMDEIHEPGAGVPKRMAPLVLLGTLATHLCGGSAGREGTAVQMGGSMASFAARRLAWLRGRLGAGSPAAASRARPSARTLLMAGVAAGFGGVFGTPLAGAVFALEVPTIGRMDRAAALPCLVASFAADWACTAWGIHHTAYRALLGPLADSGHGVQAALLGKVALAGIAFGLVARGFSALVHAEQRALAAAVRRPYARPVAGGLAVIALVALFGTRDFLGLGVTSPDPGAVTIESAFREGGAQAWSWLGKLLFSVVTLGSGFKGGEVTPLFFVGATLGHALASPLAAPFPLLAAVGLVAVFAGAANTPLACTLMAAELFGPADLPYFATGCLAAWVCSGHSGIYASQRIGRPKPGSPPVPPGTPLRDARARRRGIPPG
jgi:H+/Cl- antiporter ClcA